MNQVMEELENERWATLPTLTTHDLSISVSTLFIKNQSPYEVVWHLDFLSCVISSNWKLRKLWRYNIPIMNDTPGAQ